MVYVDYDYYLKKYYGTLPEDSFKSLVLKASREIDKNVNSRLTEEKIKGLSNEAQDQLQYTACALIDLIYRKQENENKKISSYSIDGVSKTFKVITNEEYKASKREILECLPDELTRFL